MSNKENNKKMKRQTGIFTIEKVKRNFEGSYAIFKYGKKSITQYNTGTMSHLLKMTNEEFVNYSNTLSYED